FFLERGRFAKIKALSRINALNNTKSLTTLLQNQKLDKEFLASEKAIVDTFSKLTKAIQKEIAPK
ncbi:MAG: hypothetical protein P1V97_27180, partial [Planctomycetota bacterium]|nr:hypothetical protein [Planctomycetota bacterium]